MVISYQSMLTVWPYPTAIPIGRLAWSRPVMSGCFFVGDSQPFIDIALYFTHLWLQDNITTPPSRKCTFPSICHVCLAYQLAEIGWAVDRVSSMPPFRLKKTPENSPSQTLATFPISLSPFCNPSTSQFITYQSGITSRLCDGFGDSQTIIIAVVISGLLIHFNF